MEEPEGHCPLANQERAPTWGLWGDRDSLEHPHLHVTVLDARESGVRSRSKRRGGRRKWKGRGQGTRGAGAGDPGRRRSPPGSVPSSFPIHTLRSPSNVAIFSPSDSVAGPPHPSTCLRVARTHPQQQAWPSRCLVD